MRNETKDEKGWFIIKYFIMVPLLLLALIMMASCNVEKTDEGKMPDVDVEVDSGELPEYDVELPDVDIRTEQKTVTVPDVDVEMKKTQVEVPTVEVTMPDENNDEEVANPDQNNVKDE